MIKFPTIALLWFAFMLPNINHAMDVHFESRSLQEVLPWLASQMNESLILSPEIDQALTVSIKNASWKDVMDAVSQLPNITLEWQGEVAVLMPKSAETIDLASPTCQHSYWMLRYAKAESVGKHLQTLYPSLNLIVDARTNSVIVHNCDSKIDIKRTISWLDIPLRQIEISAQIAQVTKSAQSQFGVNWQAKLSDNVRSSIGGAVDLRAITPTSSVLFSSSGSSGLLSLALDMMESDGSANVLSKPKIVTSEGKAAKIESGTEVPYQTVNDDKVSVEFRQASLMLEVTPFVKEGGQILLLLNIHQDAVGELVNGVPSLKTNRLKTQVVVKDQETLVLGGIFREEVFKSESSVPLLSKIPWLGSLFKRQSMQQEKVELLVFITPKLLQMSVN